MTSMLSYKVNKRANFDPLAVINGFKAKLKLIKNQVFEGDKGTFSHICAYNMCIILSFVIGNSGGLIITAHISPYLFSGTPDNGVVAGATGVKVLFHNNSIIGNIMVGQDRLETNLLQLFTHP